MKNTFLLLSTVLIILASCTKVKNTTTASISNDIPAIEQQVDVPLPNVKKPPYVFKINASESHELVTKTGSKITIPKDAFVDKKGNPISGDVEVTFEEFHDATDIILSGIPMNITTEDGEMGSFESAGMFNISGSQNGEEIRIDNNKTIEIELASFEEESDFNFYEFDKEKGQWIEEAKAVSVTENEIRKEAEQNLKELPPRPIEIKKASSNDFVFEIAVDKRNNPEFESFDNVMWRLADKNTESESLFSTTIRNPNLECIDQEKSIFRLTGSANKKKIKTRVQPVMFGSNLKKAQAAFKVKLTGYKKALEQKKEEEAKIDQMGKFSRSMALNSFGTYNFDRLYKVRKKVQFNALFFIPALKKVFKKGYLIQGKKKISIPYSRSGYYKFTFNPKERNTVITFDEDGNLYEFRADDFESLQNTKLTKDDEYTFRMRETGIKIQNATDLKSYLASL
ncbi:MAG: hypothetical protein HKP14_11760 [Bacteroidia bacterium]|nr:hypothetical protein [Bacteroidia bacterium]